MIINLTSHQALPLSEKSQECKMYPSQAAKLYLHRGYLML